MINKKLFESNIVSWIALNPGLTKEVVASHMISCIKKELDTVDIYTWKHMSVLWSLLGLDLFEDYFNEKMSKGKKAEAYFIVDVLLLLQKIVEKNTPKQREKLYIEKEHEFVSGVNLDFNPDPRLTTAQY
jgi:hypothetical protein